MDKKNKTRDDEMRRVLNSMNEYAIQFNLIQKPFELSCNKITIQELLYKFNAYLKSVKQSK